MKQVITKLDKIILFCKNIQKTSGFYSQALGLKVYIQSEQFCQLKDSNNFSIYLQSSKVPSQLIKGYSPLLSFKVENFDQTYEKLKKYDLIIQNDQIQKSQFGKVATFMGLDNQIISINDFKVIQEQQDNKEEGNINSQDDNSADQIKRLLKKIKI